MDVVESVVNEAREAFKHGAPWDQHMWLTELIDILEVIRFELEDQLIREGEL